MKRTLAKEILLQLQVPEHIDDVSNGFWALKTWATNQSIFERANSATPLHLSYDDVLHRLLARREDTDGASFFKVRQPPKWDFTPEIYKPPRSTLFSLLNLSEIQKATRSGRRDECKQAIRRLDSWARSCIEGFLANENQMAEWRNPVFLALFIQWLHRSSDSTGKASITSSIKKVVFEIERKERWRRIARILVAGVAGLIVLLTGFNILDQARLSIVVSIVIWGYEILRDGVFY
jgi:hypothetical protein